MPGQRETKKNKTQALLSHSLMAGHGRQQGARCSIVNAVPGVGMGRQDGGGPTSQSAEKGHCAGGGGT